MKRIALYYVDFIDTTGRLNLSSKYGFGMNPPAAIYGTSRASVIRQLKRELPKHIEIRSVAFVNYIKR